MLENGKWLLLPFSQISSYPFADNNSGCKQWCLTSRETIRLIRDEEKSGGEANEGGGGRETIYLSLHCHHQNDFCIKMDSDESHFNVS